RDAETQRQPQRNKNRFLYSHPTSAPSASRRSHFLCGSSTMPVNSRSHKTEYVVSPTRTESRSAVGTRKFAGKRVHFIGIGGSGMSGLAAMLLDDGAIVSGSEPKPNGPVFELTKRGAKISRDQIGELLGKQIDLVVRTA